MINLEQSVAIPENREKSQTANWDNLRSKLPFAKMEVGDSFELSPADFGVEQIVLQNYLSGAACQYRKERPIGTWAFTTRQMPNGNVRVWRVNPKPVYA